MSTPATTHRNAADATPAPAVLGAIVCAIVVAAVAAVVLALTPGAGSSQRATPTGECAGASCVGAHTRLLPGRHALPKWAGGGFHPTTTGSRVMIGRP